jgi:hypothetical protein
MNLGERAPTPGIVTWDEAPMLTITELAETVGIVARRERLKDDLVRPLHICSPEVLTAHCGKRLSSHHSLEAGCPGFDVGELSYCPACFRPVCPDCLRRCRAVLGPHTETPPRDDSECARWSG